MSVTTQTSNLSLSATFPVSTDALVTNVTMATADTEYSHTFQNNLKKFILRTRLFEPLKITFVSSESGTKYITIPAACSLTLDGLSFSGKIIYMQSPSSNVVVEILETY